MVEFDKIPRPSILKAAREQKKKMKKMIKEVRKPIGEKKGKDGKR